MPLARTDEPHEAKVVLVESKNKVKICTSLTGCRACRDGTVDERYRVVVVYHTSALASKYKLTLSTYSAQVTGPTYCDWLLPAQRVSQPVSQR
jgi:hypothetical protein